MCTKIMVLIDFVPKITCVDIFVLLPKWCRNVYLSTHLPTYIQYLPIYLPTYLPSYLCTYLSTVYPYLPTYFPMHPSMADQASGVRKTISSGRAQLSTSFEELEGTSIGSELSLALSALRISLNYVGAGLPTRKLKERSITWFKFLFSALQRQATG